MRSVQSIDGDRRIPTDFQFLYCNFVFIFTHELQELAPTHTRACVHLRLMCIAFRNTIEMERDNHDDDDDNDISKSSYPSGR